MFKPTVEKIMSGFTKTIDQLESLSSACEVESKLIIEKIEALEDKQAVVDGEGMSARSVAIRLKALIAGGDTSEE